MYISTANNVTENDWQNLKSYSNKQKAILIYTYLVGQDGVIYNLQEVANAYLNTDDGRQVSSVCRCYNIGENEHRHNAGIYSKNSQFVKKYGEIELSDIEEFVSKYPNGCYPNVIIENFLIEKAEKKLALLEAEKQRIIREKANAKELELLQQEEEIARRKEELEIAKQNEHNRKIQEQRNNELINDYSNYKKKIIKNAITWLNNTVNSHNKYQKNGNDKIKINDIVKFGSYYIDKNSYIENKKSHLQWIVLDIIDDTVLLYNRYIIAYKVPFSDLFTQDFEMFTYRNSDVRKFVNEEFYELAFSDEEKQFMKEYTFNNDVNIQKDAHWTGLVRDLPSAMFEKIMKKSKNEIDNGKISDKVFLLSYDELKKYKGINCNNLPTMPIEVIRPEDWKFQNINQSAYLTRDMSIITMFGGCYGRVMYNNRCEIEEIIKEIPKELYKPYGVINEKAKKDDIYDEEYNNTRGYMQLDNPFGVRPAIYVDIKALQ